MNTEEKTTVADLKKFVLNIEPEYDDCEVYVWNTNGSTYMPNLSYGCKKWITLFTNVRKIIKSL